MPTPGPLPLPTDGFHNLALPIIEVPQTKTWFRSHPVDLGPVHYGRNARFRFDDPAMEYGVFYVAEDPFGAFVETFGQFVSTVALPRVITSEQLVARALSEVIPERSLRLVDLTGPGLAHIGADARLFAGDYTESRLVESNMVTSRRSRRVALSNPARPEKKSRRDFRRTLCLDHVVPKDVAVPWGGTPEGVE